MELAQIKRIYNEEFNLNFSEEKLEEELKECNKNAGIANRSAEDWARFYAAQLDYEYNAEAQEANKFHSYAYGND